MKFVRAIPRSRLFFTLVVASAFIMTTLTCSNHGIHKYLTMKDKIQQNSRFSISCDDQRKFPQIVLIPTFGYSSQLVYDCDVYRPTDVSVAMAVFYDTWVSTFGDDDYVVRTMLDDVMIQWGQEKKILNNVYDVKGEPREVSYVVGKVITKSMVWVYSGDGRRISGGSLIHELVHLAIRRTMDGSHGDPDHEGEKYPGWTPAHTFLIQEANRTLRALGI